MICTPRRLGALFAVAAVSAACGTSPGGLVDISDGTHPDATPTPRPPLPDALRCDGGGALDDSLPRITAPAVISTVAAAVYHAPAAKAFEATWVACPPSGPIPEPVVGGAWQDLWLTQVGQWRVTAVVDGDAVAQGLFEVSGAPGNAVRYDGGQVNQAYTPADLGAMPWPSEVYRERTTGDILLSEGSIEAAAPDAMVSLVGYMKTGLQKGWQVMGGFPVTGSLYARTEGLAGVEGISHLQDPSIFTRLGAPAFLIELEGGVVTPGARRLPLSWRYVQTYSRDLTDLDGQTVLQTFERDGLSMWLPPGEPLKEGTEYLWVLTTGIGGDRGPWFASDDFNDQMRFPSSSDSEQLVGLRDRVTQAIDALPDLPSLDVVAGAAWFKTQSFSQQLRQVRRCAIGDDCSGLNLDAVGAWPEPEPTFEDTHVYWSELPSSPKGRRQAEIAKVMDHPLIDGCQRLYPSEAYRLVAFGTFKGARLQLADTDPGADLSPVYDVFTQDDQGRLAVHGTTDLRFTLIVPKGPPASGTRYPVVVFVHGLSQDQSDVFKAAEFLATQGFALLAIDQISHGSRYPTEEGQADVLNNFWMREADQLPDDQAAQLREAAADPEQGGGGDGLADARVLGGYEVISVLGFFEGLANFKAMGDNFRQQSADLMQIERMLRQADAPNGLNTQLTTWDPGATLLSTGAPLLYGRSLGSIALGVHLAAFDDERAAVLGVPGAGVGSYLASSSPFIGTILVIGADVLDCLPGCTLVDDSELVLPVPAAEEYLRPGDPFTHLVQGIIEAGDPLALAPWYHTANRRGPAHMLMQHACDDEVVPNVATEAWATSVGVQSLAPVDVGAQVGEATDVSLFTPARYDGMTDYPVKCAGPDAKAVPPAARQSVRGNNGGATQVLLTYCPGSHAGIYDRPNVGSERYAYYPDGPFPHSSEVVFPVLEQPLEVINDHHAAREAAVEFLVSAAQGVTPVATAPGVVHKDDTDADGLPWSDDPCPLGPNAIFWEPGGQSCAAP